MSETERKLRDAYLLWREKKTLKNFRRMLRDGFTGGFIVWRMWIVIRHTWIDGRYEEIYNERWTN